MMYTKVTMKKEFQPKPVNKIYCSKCGELLIKNYPYSPFVLSATEGIKNVICLKCMSSTLKSGVA